AQSADRDLLLDALEHLLWDVLEHLGRDESRRDRVDGYPDAILLELPRPPELERRLASERLGQPEQPGLRGCVVRLPDVADLADDRGDVDDPSRPAFNHVRQHRLGHEERAREVDRDHLVPILVGHLQDRLVDRDPGIVDQDVEPPMRVNHFLDGAATVLARTDITLVDTRVDVMAAQLVQQLAGTLSVPAVTGGDDRALLGKAAADRRSDTPRAAGHERDASVQSSPAVVGRERLGSGRWVSNSHGAHRLSPRSCLSGFERCASAWVWTCRTGGGAADAPRPRDYASRARCTPTWSRCTRGSPLHPSHGPSRTACSHRTGAPRRRFRHSHAVPIRSYLGGT